MPAGKYTWHRPPLTRLGVAFLATDIRFSIDKARNRLGYAPGVSLRDGVRLAAAWEQAENAPPSDRPVGELLAASGPVT